MDGLPHAQRTWILTGIAECAFEFWDLLTPLILFAASPGTITGVITLSAAHSRLDLPVTALVAVVVASAVTWVVLLLMGQVADREGGAGFARATMTSFMGLIVLAMGVQFALTGLRQFGS